MNYIKALFLFVSSVIFAQNSDPFVIETTFLKGTILPHKKGLDHLITGHPDGVFVGFLKQSNAQIEWQKNYNYPEYGAYFLYQDFKNELLGQNFALGLQSNFYFLDRKIQFKAAAGVAMTTNPYNKETNSKNNAFGSKLMANIDVGLAYKKYFFNQKIALQAGLFFSHYSNGRTKSPNSGINTINLSLGVSYHFLDTSKSFVKNPDKLDLKYSEPIHYNFIFRTGCNQSSVVNSGQYAFYHLGFFADKRINKKSAIQFGTELFVSNFYKEFIRYQSVAYPAKNVDPNTDFKRVGLFVGHELIFNKVSVELQVGYYVYQPYKFDIPIYDRIGIKYYVNKKINTGVGVKTHGFLAEALEFSIGYRL
jgi:hypothetical protein